MFSIEVELLTGRYTAHSKQGYGTIEWPPHPGRLFSALVAAYHEHNHGDGEREALKWLETLPPPQIYAPEPRARDTITVFVPHYDHQKIVKEGGKQELIPSNRVSSNRSRTFPTVIPDEPIIHYIWKNDAEPEKQEALENLASSVPYLGDSSSLVRATINTDPPEPTLTPREPGYKELRVPGEGRLEELEQNYEQGRRPDPVSTTTYGEPEPDEPETETVSSNFSKGTGLLVLKATNQVRIPLELTHDLTSTLRNAVLSVAQDPVPPFISGHTSSGKQARRDHLAYIPLANIAHKWGTGSIMGVAAALPSDLSDDQRRKVINIFRKIGPLKMGPRGDLELELDPLPTKTSLKRMPYVGPGKMWASATPYVYDRFPDDREEKEKFIANSCRHIGLPEPAEIHLSDVSPLQGVPNATDFRLGKARFSHRPRTHVVLQFDDPVEGPVTIGKGRYRGIGAMRALQHP